LKGVSGAGLITHFDATNFKVHIASEVKGFNSDDHFDRKEARKMDLYTQYGMVVAEEAIQDAGLTKGSINLDRIGVIFATGMGGAESFQNEILSYASNPNNPRFSPFFITKTIGDICAGQISIKYGFRGPNYSTSAACASASMAISDAFMFIRLGKADAIVTGGSEAPIIPSGIGGFSSMQALSTRNDDPKTASRPYDKDRDGFVLGEGAGALVLEELEHAKARGAKIYAEITGCGLTADAYHIAASHPEGLGAMNAMRLAIEDSGMEITDVDHINTHGTSTPIGDISEPKAVVSLFGEHAKKLTLNSTKSMTGHLLGAAGAVEAIATILAIQNDVVPPTINHFTDDPNIAPLDFSFNKPTNRSVNFALSNTFGFGGHNACLAFRKY
jgi:3-oxoacyl-[acyl-carrier-protein] synthase II